MIVVPVSFSFLFGAVAVFGVLLLVSLLFDLPGAIFKGAHRRSLRRDQMARSDEALRQRKEAHEKIWGKSHLPS